MANYYSEKSKISINQLIEGNLDLVKKIAWQIFGRVQKVVEIEDLIQQGMEGLVSAAQKYSPKEVEDTIGVNLELINLTISLDGCSTTSGSLALSIPSLIVR